MKKTFATILNEHSQRLGLFTAQAREALEQAYSLHSRWESKEGEIYFKRAEELLKKIDQEDDNFQQMYASELNMLKKLSEDKTQ